MLGLFVTCLSYYGTQVHDWLETSWKVLGCLLAVFLIVTGLSTFVTQVENPTALTVFLTTEVVELVVYVLLVVADTLSSHSIPSLQLGLWFSTFMISLLWLFSSLLELLSNENPRLSTFVTLAATSVIAVLVLVDVFLFILKPSSVRSCRRPWQDLKNDVEQEALDYEPVQALADTNFAISSGFSRDDIDLRGDLPPQL